MPPESKKIPRVLVSLAIAAALLTTVVAPTPHRLPGVALASPALLDLERAALVATLVIGVGGVLLELWRGGRVSSVGGGPVPAVDVQSATATSAELDEIYERLEELERRQAGER